MIERAIENWLTNTNERNYQIAFCHVLMHKGYKILYISPHRPLEQGKDIIAIDQNGECLAYQLKGGDINLSEWRKIKGEVMELIELPIVHPSCDKRRIHRSYLVFNGEMTDEVRIQIDQINEQNSRMEKGYSYLDTIGKNSLISEFIKAQGQFLPKELEEFNLFLELFLADGTDFIDKEKLFYFFNEVFFGKSIQKADALNSIYSSVIITSYILNQYQLKNNHYAQFETWVILASCIKRFVQDQNVKEANYRETLDLILDEIAMALQQLKKEVLDRRNFLEGSLMGDGGDIYKSRVTIVLGVLAAFEMLPFIKDAQHEVDKDFLQMVKGNIKYLTFWGESAFPYFFYIIKYLELNEEFEDRDALLFGIFNTLVKLNSPKSPAGQANPYYSISDLLEAVFFDIEKINFREFTGSSYILESLIEMLARRGNRGILKDNWKAVSYIQFKEFKPDSQTNVFTWREEEGLNYAAFPSQTQSWDALVTHSKNLEDVPDFYKENLILLSLFIIVCPHRLNSRILKLLDFNGGK